MEGTRVINLRTMKARPGRGLYIGRPGRGQNGPYGNKFIVGVHGQRGECINMFRRWVWLPEQKALRNQARREMPGKDLECFCKPYACHGDVWLEVIATPMEP